MRFNLLIEMENLRCSSINKPVERASIYNKIQEKDIKSRFFLTNASPASYCPTSVTWTRNIVLYLVNPFSFDNIHTWPNGKVAIIIEWGTEAMANKTCKLLNVASLYMSFPYLPWWSFQICSYHLTIARSWPCEVAATHFSVSSLEHQPIHLRAKLTQLSNIHSSEEHHRYWVAWVSHWTKLDLLIKTFEMGKEESISQDWCTLLFLTHHVAVWDLLMKFSLALVPCILVPPMTQFLAGGCYMHASKDAATLCMWSEFLLLLWKQNNMSPALCLSESLGFPLISWIMQSQWMPNYECAFPVPLPYTSSGIYVHPSI